MTNLVDGNMRLKVARKWNFAKPDTSAKKQFARCFVKISRSKVWHVSSRYKCVNFIFVCPIPPVCIIFCHISRSKFWHFRSRNKGWKWNLVKQIPVLKNNLYNVSSNFKIQGRKFHFCLPDPARVHNVLSHFKIQILTFSIQIQGRQFQFFFSHERPKISF